MTRLAAFLRLRAAGLGVAALLVVVLFSVLGPLVVSQRPDDVDILTPPFGPPSRAHLLGTDELGRDVLVRLMHGGRVDLLVGGVAMLVAVLAGTSIGLVGGLLGGWTDFALMRVTDTFMSVPAFFVMLTLLTLLGPAIPTIVLAIGLTSWMNVARVIRAEVLALRSLDYVEAARALGVSTPRLIVVHIVPNVVPSVIVASTLGVAWVLLVSTSLSYLGLGVQPPTPSWGNMLSNSQNYFWVAPVLVVYPGLLIIVTVLATNVIGEALREVLGRQPARGFLDIVGRN
jgi:peptide/nickel transport system permease protein